MKGEIVPGPSLLGNSDLKTEMDDDKDDDNDDGMGEVS